MLRSTQPTVPSRTSTTFIQQHAKRWRGGGVVCWLTRSCRTVGPVSTWMGDCLSCHVHTDVGMDGGRRRRSSFQFDVHDIHHVQQHANRCSHRRLDTCTWPQCNLACPKLRNPFTGSVVRLSVVCLSHLCTLLKPFDGFRCHLAGTLVMSNDTLC